MNNNDMSLWFYAFVLVIAIIICISWSTSYDSKMKSDLAKIEAVLETPILNYGKTETCSKSGLCTVQALFVETERGNYTCAVSGYKPICVGGGH